MINNKELDFNLRNCKSLGFPSADEIIEYTESGEDKKNALEYENAYIALIEQVKGKSHGEQVKFLISHMDELRGMLDLFSYCRDEELFPESILKEEPNANDEILANLMIYRYENNISILDDQYCEQSDVYVRKVRSEIYKRRSQERRLALFKLKKEHPEQYLSMLEKDRCFAEELAKGLERLNKKIGEKFTTEELLNYNGDNFADYYNNKDK